MELKGVFLTLTNKCNICCKYCYQNSSPWADTSGELKPEDWKRLLKRLKNLDVKKFNFVGGEPFLYPKLWDILKEIEKGSKIRIFTNGLLLDKHKIRKLKEQDITLSFNLNSSQEDIHNSYQSRGNWKKVVKNIKKCKRINFEVSSPLTKKNYGEVGEFVTFCKRLGAKRIRFVPLIPNENLKRETLSSKELSIFKKKIKALKDLNITLGCKTCEGGKSYLTIQPNGDVTPCSRKKDLILGNIKKESLKSILKRSRKIQFKSCNE